MGKQFAKGRVVARLQLAPDMRIVFHEKTGPLNEMFADAIDRFKKEGKENAEKGEPKK